MHGPMNVKVRVCLSLSE